MKTIILLVSLFLGLQLSYHANAQGDKSSTKATKKTATAPATATADTKSGNVYVCSSKTAKAYHSKKDCGMLKKCKGEIKEYSKADAESKGYTACKSCNKASK